MLLVAKPGCESSVAEVLSKWDLEAAVVGRVTDDGFFRVRDGGEVVVEIPVQPLVNECPTYTREGVEDPEVRRLRELDIAEYSAPISGQDAEDALLTLLDSPSLASCRWIYEQYDTTVGTNTVVGPGSDAAVLRLADSGRGIAASLDCNGRYVYLEPRRGAKIALAEAARNVACSGARPVAITNCLNFGNPLKPGTYYHFAEAVAGLGEGCRVLSTPVTGGNVSFYNETPDGAVYPTPVIGMIGLLEHLDRVVPSCFRTPGSAVVLVGEARDELGASEYLAACHGVVGGAPPQIDLEEAGRLVDFLVEAAERRLVLSAHDCAEGGIAVTLAECSLGGADGPLAVEAELETETPAAAAFFGESQSRVVLSCDPEKVEEVEALAAEHRLPVAVIGRVGSPDGRFRLAAAGVQIDLELERIHDVYRSALPGRMEKQAGLTT
jgi:phosphoribosylformylglycinamidine synthase